MAEYIEREAAIDSLLGWAEQLTETYGKNDEYVLCLQSAAHNIEQIPAADVRPVVLCRDCRHWEYDAIFFDGWCRGRQQGNPNWYCADGEKREES